MAYYFATIYIIVSITGTSLAQLLLTPGVQQAEKNMNDSYVVACHGPNITNATWWNTENKVITADKGRVHVERKEGPEAYLSLVFERIERSDRGNYTCSANINGTKKEISFKLIVFKPISFVGAMPKQSLIEFRTDTIRCEVLGDPAPVVLWQFKGKVLPKHGSRYQIMPRGLHITNITKEDAGNYLCRALQVTTQSSTVKDQIIELHVHRKPRWKTPLVHGDMENNRVYGYKNGIANLTCEVDGEPDAEFAWTRNNKTVDPTYTIINDPNKSVLQVPLVNSTVLGNYECSAWNSIGKMFKQFDLQEGSKPPKPNSISVGTVGAVSAGLHIHRPSHDTIGYRVQFVKRYPDYNFSHPDYQDVFTSGRFPYMILNLTENTDYVFRVASRNRAGLSEYSEEYTFKTRIRAASSASEIYINHVNILFCLTLIVLKGMTTISQTV